MRVPWTAATATLLVACATTPVPSSSADPVPAERILAPEFTRPREGLAMLVVTRDVGLRMKACSTSFFVEGVKVAKLEPGEQLRLFVEEGAHLVGVKAEGTICFICG
jgi:hypothetical protein